MAKNAKEMRYALDGNLWIAEYGVALPTTISDPLDPEFGNLGYATEDGTTATQTLSAEDKKVWQEPEPVDKRVTERGYTLAAQLVQTNREVYSAAFGGGEWKETEPGEYEYLPPAGTDRLPEYSLIVDIEEEDVHDRIIIPRCVMAEEVAVQYVRNNAAEYPLTFTALAPGAGKRPWRLQTNNPDMAPGS